jgi:hypothetical protein
LRAGHDRNKYQPAPGAEQIPVMDVFLPLSGRGMHPDLAKEKSGMETEILHGVLPITNG